MSKKKMSVLMTALALALTIVLACVLVACGEDSADPTTPSGNVPSTPQKPAEPDEYVVAPTLDVYSQRSQIGYSQSLKSVARYSEYNAGGSAAFLIPGLLKDENFVLQGIDYCEEKNWALLAGYINPETSSKNSVIFVIDMSVWVKVEDGVFLKGALIKEILLDKADGKPFTGHAGGVAVSEKNVWIANDGKLYYIPLADVVSAPASSHIALKNSVSVPVNASYASYADGMLWVGEFEYARDDYDTDAYHHNAEDASLTAWTVGYRLDETGAAGYDAATGILSANLKGKAIPDVVLWHGEKVQGMTSFGASGDVKIALSTSYGRKNDSALLLYDASPDAEPDLTVSIEEADVPCYILKDARKIVAPPMLEDIAAVKEGSHGYLLLATESGSYFYHGYNLLSISKNPVDYVWKFKVY